MNPPRSPVPAWLVAALALLLCAFGCAPGLDGQQPQGARQPAAAPPAPTPAAPFLPEPSEAVCSQLIAVPGDGVASIMLKVSREESAAEVLGQFVHITDEWFRCAPRFRASSEEVRARAIGALRHLASVVEKWYEAKGLVRLRSHELLGLKQTATDPSDPKAVVVPVDRRDLARAYWRIEDELRRGRAIGPFPETAARASAQRDGTQLLLRTDATAAALSLMLAGGSCQEDVGLALADYQSALAEEARGMGLGMTQHREGAPINPARRLPRGKAKPDRSPDPASLTYADMSIADRMLLVQHQVDVLGRTFRGGNEAFRDAIGVPVAAYFDVVANTTVPKNTLTAGELTVVDFLAPLPTRDGTRTKVTGTLAFLALQVRAHEAANVRSLLDFAEAERQWELAHRELRPQGPLDLGTHDDLQDRVSMEATQALVSAVEHTIRPEVAIEALGRMTTRINLVLKEAELKKQVGRYFIRKRLSRFYAETALCLLNATVRGTPARACSLVAQDPQPTKPCDPVPATVAGLPGDALAGLAATGVEQILRALALQADLSTQGATTSSAADVGWTHGSRCALQILADASIYPRLGTGVAGDSAMLRLIAALQLRPSEPSVCALAEGTFRKARAALSLACHDARGQGCDEALLAKLAGAKAPPTPPVQKGAKAPPVEPDLRALHMHNLRAYCDAAYAGGDAFTALQAQPGGALSLSQQYWNGHLPNHLNAMGSGISAERAACLAEPLLLDTPPKIPKIPAKPQS